jgi:hypothetical protein
LGASLLADSDADDSFLDDADFDTPDLAGSAVVASLFALSDVAGCADPDDDSSLLADELDELAA